MPQEINVSIFHLPQSAGARSAWQLLFCLYIPNLPYTFSDRHSRCMLQAAINSYIQRTEIEVCLKTICRINHDTLSAARNILVNFPDRILHFPLAAENYISYTNAFSYQNCFNATKVCCVCVCVCFCLLCVEL